MSAASKHPVTIRPPSDLHERLADAAAWLGISLNSFILQAAAERANSVLEKRQILNLSKADAELILDLMDGDTQPNEHLRKVFASRTRLLHALD